MNKELLPESLFKYFEKILLTKKNNIKIIATKTEKDNSVLSSKFLGIPYWNKNKEYPIGLNGKPLVLLCQINFLEIFNMGISLDFFPNSGILQFFIPNIDFGNQFHGLSFDSHPNNIKVVYHADIEIEHYLDNNFSKLNSEVDHSLPIFNFCKLHFEKNTSYCSLTDNYNSSFYYSEFIENLSDDESDDFFENKILSNSGTHIDGYAYFTQEDPRGLDYNSENPWILLLQIDSMSDINGNEVCMWGDVGVANWFIKKQDLINKNFDNVFYTWDCC